MIRNKIAAKCSVCATLVGVKKGWTEGPNHTGPRWITKCEPCSGHVEEPLTIKATLHKGKALFQASGYLNDQWDSYRRCVEGALWKPEFKGNLAPLDKATRIISDLTTEFQVDVAPDLSASLQALTAQVKEDVEDAKARALGADKELRSLGLALYPFQREGIHWLAGKHGALLADDMGLGKTIQALLAIPKDVPVLVVCPAVAKGVWAREAGKWRPDLTVTIISSRKKFAMPSEGMSICSYEMLPSFSQGPHTVVGIVDSVTPNTVVIADECQALKSSRTKRSKSFRLIAGTARDKGGRSIGLDATPLANRPSELWSICQALGIAQEAFGSWHQFVRLFNGYEGPYGGYTWGRPTEDASKRLQRVMLRRLKVDVLPQLPVKTYRQVELKLKSPDRKAIESLTDYFRQQRPTAWERILSDDGEVADRHRHIPKIDPAEVEAACAQAEAFDSPQFEEFSRARTIIAKAKIPTLMALVESFEVQEEPLVVFSAHRAPIDTLDGREGWAVITGGTSSKERTRIEDEFQAGNLKGVACTIKAGGVALTLTRAYQAVFVDREWVPGLNIQAEDRLCRIGQTRGCIIIDLITDHWLDSKIAKILIHKQMLIAASVDAARQIEGEVGTEIVEVDFDALADELANEHDEVRQAKAEAEAIAAQRKEHYDSVAEERAQREAEEKARSAVERKEKAAWERALARGWVAPADTPDRHPAGTLREAWTERALTVLTALDPDRAQERNDVGFNKADGYVGHWLYQELPRGLTPDQWHLATNLCRKYHRQIGDCPD